MTDEERPRPQYGEYATPEEQRARIQQPDVTDALDAGEAPAAVAMSAQETSLDGPRRPAGSAGPGGSPANRLATILLLGFGAINVVFSVLGYLDIVPVIERAMELMGVPGSFTNVAAAQMWGVIAAIALIAVYVVTALVSWRVMSAGRLSWWIPLVGAVVGYVIASICLAVPLLADPAFMDFVSSQP